MLGENERASAVSVVCRTDQMFSPVFGWLGWLVGCCMREGCFTFPLRSRVSTLGEKLYARRQQQRQQQDTIGKAEVVSLFFFYFGFSARENFSVAAEATKG